MSYTLGQFPDGGLKTTEPQVSVENLRETSNHSLTSISVVGDVRLTETPALRQTGSTLPAKEAAPGTTNVTLRCLKLQCPGTLVWHNGYFSRESPLPSRFLLEYKHEQLSLMPDTSIGAREKFRPVRACRERTRTEAAKWTLL